MKCGLQQMKWLIFLCLTNTNPLRYTLTDPVAEFKSFAMNKKAFGNVFCNSQKSFHTSPGSSNSDNRSYRSFFQFNNGICISKKKILGVFCKCKCRCWVWRMIESLYYSSRKIPERYLVLDAMVLIHQTSAKLGWVQGWRRQPVGQNKRCSKIKVQSPNKEDAPK